MIGEIICVGNELLIGDTLNTNTQYLSQKLTELGVDVAYQVVVGDHEVRLLSAINTAAARSDVIIFSGGLGPTYDDMTKETVVKSLGLEMEIDEMALANMKHIYKISGRVMPEVNIKQAYKPVGGEALHNNNGTAPGIYVEKDGTHYFLLPGPPRELEPMFIEKVAPVIKTLSEDVITSRIFKLFGIGESDLSEKIGHIMDISDNPRIAPYAKLGMVNIRVTANSKTKALGESMVEDITNQLMPYIGEYVYTYEDKSLEELVVEMLNEKGLTIAAAESCTGGLLSSQLIEVPGASSVYMNGFITYSNAAKEKWIDVDPELIKRHGAVSREVAIAMAKGVKKVSGTDIGVAITGIAGPGGGTKEKPVGTVHIAFAYGEQIIEKEYRISGSRDKVRRYSALRAIMSLFDLLK